MLILPHSCFFHVPKTGGSWAKKAIMGSGIICEDYRVDGNPHIGIKHCPAPEKFKFAFVRHPVNLYRSYWQFKMTHGWDQKNQIDNDCRSDNFHEFIENILNKYPGIYGDTLSEYIGEGKNEIDFIGKYENLAKDLILALNLAGESFDDQFIKNFPPFNVSNKQRYPAKFSKYLENRVKITEASVMHRFNYE